MGECALVASGLWWARPLRQEQRRWLLLAALCPALLVFAAVAANGPLHCSTGSDARRGASTWPLCSAARLNSSIVAQQEGEGRGEEGRNRKGVEQTTLDQRRWAARGNERGSMVAERDRDLISQFCQCLAAQHQTLSLLNLCVAAQLLVLSSS